MRVRSLFPLLLAGGLFLALAVVSDFGPAAAAKKGPVASVVAGKVTVKSNRKLKVPVKCSRGAGTCKGKLVLRKAGSNKLLAKKTFRIKQGKKQQVKLRLRAADYDGLVEAGKLRAKATAVTKQGKGKKPRKKTRTVVLKAAVGSVAPAEPPIPPPPPPVAPPVDGSGCDPSYPTVCIPPAPPDLNCGDVEFTDFVVRQPDPHKFDGNKDGRGCEG